MKVRSVYFILAAVYKRVRASRTTARFDCTEAEVAENATKTSGNKADIIGRSVTTWKATFDVAPETCGTSAAATIDMPAFNELRSCTKDEGPVAASPSCSCTTTWSTARRKRSIKVDGGLKTAQGVPVLCR